MSHPVLIDTLGWIGTVLYLAAYLLVSLKKLEGDSLSYQAMNIIAGILLVINTLYWRAFPSLGLNAAWIGIGLFTLGRKWLGGKNAGQA
ncbi:MAG: CBU_0592 family membrane protein [Bacteroidota bacterium]